MDDKELTIDISREAGVCRVVMRVVGTKDGISGAMADTPPVWEPTDPEMYGKKLFEWLLSAKDDNQETIDSFWHQMKGKYPKRHVVLNVWPPDDVPLRMAVWECLNDGGDLLSTSAETTFCRTIDHDRNVPSPLRSGTALKVLLIVPTPSDQTTEFPILPLLNADEEVNSLRTIFENSGYPVELKRMASPCSMEAIATELRDGWHIVHFIGHGTILDREPAILIEGQDGKAVWEEAGKFVLTIRDILGVGGDDEDRRVRLIFLASCDTANTDIDTPRSLAYEIMKAGMPAVIAMQDAVALKDARDFAKRFYQKLLKDGRVDVAANAARSIARVTARDGASSPFIPVLYNRLHEGRLIELAAATPVVPPPAEPPSLPIFEWIKSSVLIKLALLILILATAGAWWIFVQEDDPPPTPTSATGTPSAPPTVTATMTSEASVNNPLVGTPFLEIIARTSVNVRKGPGIEYDCFNSTALRGSTWPIIGRSTDGKWWQIQWEAGQIAWVSSDTQLTSPQHIENVRTSQHPPTPIPLYPDSPTGIVNTRDGKNEGVNLRNIPDGGTIIATIPEGRSLILISRSIDNKWFQVRWECKEGWVFAEFVDPILPDGSVAPTVTPSTTETPTATETPTSTAIPTATPTRPPRQGDILSVPLPEGGMEVARVFVPRGSFLMGTDDGATDEGPEHEVRLDAFWVDRTEVTNEQYAACVVAGECSEPESFSSYSRANYYLADGFAGYPVIHVTWYDADRYCAWAGGSLPTEAQWEYAARGPEGRDRVYPWGDESASCALVNYAGTCNGDTDHVESRPVGKSWVNALNLAGNVTEWVNDWFSSSSYGRSVRTNPQGPPTGLTKVLRGGAWDDRAVWVRSFSRYQKADPDDQNDQIGFRCAYPVMQP